MYHSCELPVQGWIQEGVHCVVYLEEVLLDPAIALGSTLSHPHVKG